MYTEIAVLLGVVLAITGNSRYILSVWRKDIHPHPITWFVGSIVSGVTFFGALAKGGGIGVIPILASEIFTILIFILTLRLSIHRSFSNVRSIDIIFLVACLVGVIPWYLTQDPTISVITVVIIDIISFMPTIRKVRTERSSENGLLFISNVLRHVLILLTLAQINIATSLHSFAMIVVNVIVVFYIYRTSLSLRKV